MADLLADTLAPLQNSGGYVHTRLNWSAVLRMMEQARSQCSADGHHWLALSLCTICAGVAIRTVGQVATNLDFGVVRHVLLEALAGQCMHRDDQQSASVLKVVSAASLKIAGTASCVVPSDQVPTLQQDKKLSRLLLSQHWLA